MGITYRYLSAPSNCDVLDWFRSSAANIREVPTPRSRVLYFPDMGPLRHGEDGTIDQRSSPVVTIFAPVVRRGVIWTVGEVHFLPTPLRKLFPGLHRLSGAFRQWLESHELVFSNSEKNNQWNYYLEGSVKNFDPPVYALAGGIEALSKGQYFVSEDDNDFVIEKLCKALRLRGVSCAPLGVNDEA
jgi:hypothetical protein